MAANKVLIVDEVATRRAKIREMLPSGNFEVIEAADGEEALVLLESDRAGLRVAIVNLELPVVSGWEVLKTLQTDPQLQKIATLIVSDRAAAVTEIVPEPYFNYIEVIETSCDRIPFQKALKAALGKAKLPRSPLPAEPLAPVADEAMRPASAELASSVSPTSESEAKVKSPPPESSTSPSPAPAPTADNTEENRVSAAVPEFVNPFAGLETPKIETKSEFEPAFVDPLALSENTEPPDAPTPSEAFADPFALSESQPQPEPAPVNPEPLQPAAPVIVEEPIAVEPEGWASNNGAFAPECAVAPTPYAALECERTLGDRGARGIGCLAISPDGQYLLAGSASHPIQIWDLATRTLVVQWSLFSKEIACLAVMPDGHTVVTGAERTKVKRWDFLTGELLGPLNDAAVGVSAIAIAPDGSTLISGAIDSNIKLWDLQTGALVAPLNDYSFGTTAIAITPDGSILVTGYENSNIKLWDFATGDLLGPLNIHSSQTTCLALSPDNQLAISGHQNGAIEFTHLDSGEVLRRLKAHNRAVTGIVISPDGQSVISACDEEVKFWGAKL